MSEEILRMSPQSVEVEKHIIGAMLMDDSCVAEVRSILKPGNFYLRQHEVLCRAIFDLDTDGIVPDLITVSEKLKQLRLYDDAGGNDYLMDISSEVVSAANVKRHAEIILDKSIRRTMLDFGSRFLEAARDTAVPTGELLSKYDSGLLTLARQGAKEEPVAVGDTMKAVMGEIELRAMERASGKVSGMTTGYKSLDELLNYLEGGQEYIIGGIPGSGKTLLGTNIGMNLARKQIPGLFLSGEMSRKSLGYRLLASESRIALSHLKRGSTPQHEYINLARGMVALKNMPFYIDDSSRLTPSIVRSKARLMIRKAGIKWLMVDYFQLMSSDRKFTSRYEEMTQCAIDLLAVARDLNLPLFVMSQLDKDAARGGIPTMGSVKETGQLNQDAHTIILVHRPTMFDKKVKEQKSEDPFSALGAEYSVGGKVDPELMYAIIEKNRDGATGSVMMRCKGGIQTIEDY